MSVDTAQPTPTARARRERGPSLVGPAILVGLGLLFLGQNLGLLAGDMWMHVWRLWPVLLVLAGIELIFGRSGWAGAIGIMLAVLLVAGAVAWTAFVGVASRGDFVWWRDVYRTPSIERLDEELGSVRQASVSLRHAAGRLSMSALPADSPQLIHAELGHNGRVPTYTQVNRQNGSADISLRSPDEHDFPFGLFGANYAGDWQVALSPQPQLKLDVESGASSMDLDLTGLKVTDLEVQTGASTVSIKLPEAAGRTTARIKAGAAGIDLLVPEGVAARINSRGGLTGLNVDQERFPRSGRYYQSPGYDTAQNRIDLNIDTGVSGVTIR